jgi:flavin-dependent dehydrogenase
MKVALYDKGRFPRPKLCGGFISGEALPELDELGILDPLKLAGAWPIRRVVIGSSKGIEASSDLAHPAFSVSRYVLDSLLIEESRRAGVDVHEGDDGYRHAGEARWTVMATGRSSHPEGKWNTRRYYGIQAFFDDVAGVTDQVELDLVPGGYAGLNRQENGLTNICCLISQTQILEHGPDLDHLLRTLAEGNPMLLSHLRDARRQSSWQAVGPVAMGFRQLVSAETFYVGDAACVVDPFVGEGMAMALGGARFLAQALTQNPAAAGHAYEKAWHRAFDRPLRLQAWLRKAIQSPTLQEILVRGTQAFPPLLDWLTVNTRPYAKFKPNTNLSPV